MPHRPAAMRILVVDDNVDAANTLGLLLRFEGHEVEVAYGAQAALEKARAAAPAMVFVDIAMPGMDGYELAKRLRALPGCAGAALVALSGYPAEELAMQADAAGIEFRLTKPIDVRKALAIVAEVAGRSESK
jgi:CheY-like chemotaxis protein